MHDLPHRNLCASKHFGTFVPHFCGNIGTFVPHFCGNIGTFVPHFCGNIGTFVPHFCGNIGTFVPHFCGNIGTFVPHFCGNIGTFVPHFCGNIGTFVPHFCGNNIGTFVPHFCGNIGTHFCGNSYLYRLLEKGLHNTGSLLTSFCIFWKAFTPSRIISLRVMADGWLVLGLSASRSESVNLEYASFAALINTGRPEQIAVFPSVQGYNYYNDTQKKTKTISIPSLLPKSFKNCCHLVDVLATLYTGVTSCLLCFNR